MTLKEEIKLLTHLKNEYKKDDDKFRWHQMCNLLKCWKNYDETVRNAILDSIFKNF